MPDNTKTIEKLMTLFRGSTLAHGVYTEVIVDPLKQKVKGKAMTISSCPTIKKWQEHFDGKVGLGIIPINEDNRCYWGVLDIDGEVDHMSLLTTINNLNLPLVCCFSKSKSAHCFLFVEESIEAAVMRSLLEEMASKLGHAGCEIFPKQDRLHLDRGDLGNWLNMPYFGNTRRGIILHNNAIIEEDVDAFLERAYEKRLRADSVTTTAAELKKNIDTLDAVLEGAPPCLQYILNTRGIVDGERNNMLFNIAVYCKKKYEEEDFKDKVKEIHDKFSSEPLSLKELERILSSADAKEYRYQCKSTLLKQYCNSSTCVDREFGIDLSTEIKSIKNAVRILSTPPIYAVEVELEAGLPAKVYVDTEQLFSQDGFRRECAKQLHKTFTSMSKITWDKLAVRVVNTAINQDPPIDMSEENLIYVSLTEYILNRVRTTNACLADPDGVYHDSDDHKIYFKLEDFRAFLLRRQLFNKDLTVWKLGHKLNNLFIPTDEVDFKAETRIKRKVIISEATKKIKGKAIYTRCISDSDVDMTQILATEIKGEI